MGILTVSPREGAVGLGTQDGTHVALSNLSYTQRLFPVPQPLKKLDNKKTSTIPVKRGKGNSENSERPN